MRRKNLQDKKNNENKIKTSQKFKLRVSSYNSTVLLFHSPCMCSPWFWSHLLERETWWLRLSPRSNDKLWISRGSNKWRGETDFFFGNPGCCFTPDYKSHARCATSLRACMQGDAGQPSTDARTDWSGGESPARLEAAPRAEERARWVDGRRGVVTSPGFNPTCRYNWWHAGNACISLLTMFNFKPPL